MRKYTLKPGAFTVGALRDILHGLPDEMPVRLEWDSAWCIPQEVIVASPSDLDDEGNVRWYKLTEPMLLMDVSDWGRGEGEWAERDGTEVEL